jgi:hypothetical protein
MRILSFRGFAALVVAGICTVSQARAQQDRESPLKAVERVTVNVAISGKDLPPSVTAERLKTVIELKLRIAGLRVVTPSEVKDDPDAIPSLELTLIGVPARSGPSDIGWAFSSRLAIREYRPSRRNNAIVPNELWADAYLYITETGNAGEQAERVLTLLLDKFANDWLKANPRS